MPESVLAKRLGPLPAATVFGRKIRVARGSRARFLGLAYLEREQAGAGLLIPRCSSVHTFGMRFPLDLYFLDGHGKVIAVRRGVPSRRLAICGRARAVVELPAEEGGEIPLATP